MKEQAKVGDVIYVERGLYRHFAVYSGRGKVIHYAPPPGVDSWNREAAYIHEAPLAEFLGTALTYGICQFTADGRRVHSLADDLWEVVTDWMGEGCGDEPEPAYHLYTPQATVARARRRIGEREYDGLENNCEHFALWCKTGVASSWQVEHVVNVLSAVTKLLP